MRILLLAGIIAAVLLPGSGQKAASPAEMEVRAEIERYYTDFSARDWKAFAAHFWPGATLTTIWQPDGQPAPHVMVITVPEFVDARQKARVASPFSKKGC